MQKTQAPIGAMELAGLVNRVDHDVAEYLKTKDFNIIDVREETSAGDADHPLRRMRRLGLLALDKNGSIAEPVRLSSRGRMVRKALTMGDPIGHFFHPAWGCLDALGAQLLT